MPVAEFSSSFSCSFFETATQLAVMYLNIFIFSAFAQWQWAMRQCGDVSFLEKNWKSSAFLAVQTRATITSVFSWVFTL